MMGKKFEYRIISALMILIMLSVACMSCQETVHAETDVVKEDIISDVKNPQNGIIKYDVTVPPGERIDYSVELTPDKKQGTIDKISGTWKNRTRRTITKTIKVNVKFLSNKYKINASYTEKTLEEKIEHRDTVTAVSALKTSTVSKKLAWDFSKLGKGNKEWKYRYKYIPCKNGFKKYLQVFDSKGKQIKNNLKQTVSLSKVTKILNLMKAR